jgi:hypothetical protein
MIIMVMLRLGLAISMAVCAGLIPFVLSRNLPQALAATAIVATILFAVRYSLTRIGHERP